MCSTSYTLNKSSVAEPSPATVCPGFRPLSSELAVVPFGVARGGQKSTLHAVRPCARRGRFRYPVQFTGSTTPHSSLGLPTSLVEGGTCPRTRPLQPTRHGGGAAPGGVATRFVGSVFAARRSARRSDLSAGWASSRVDWPLRRRNIEIRYNDRIRYNSSRHRFLPGEPARRYPVPCTIRKSLPSGKRPVTAWNHRRGPFHAHNRISDVDGSEVAPGRARTAVLSTETAVSDCLRP